MYTFIVVVHVIVSIFLIVVILFQAGRGGGLADSFGGGQMQNLFGTKSASILTKLTAICATTFIITCLSLALIASRKSKSLVEKVSIPVRPVETVRLDMGEEEREEPIPAQEATTLAVDVDEDKEQAAVTVIPEDIKGGTD